MQGLTVRLPCEDKPLGKASVDRFLVVLVSIALAFALPASGQQYTFAIYQQAQGLKNSQVQAMAIDKQGFIWLATANGIERFLGSQFEHYGPEEGLSDRNVNDVHVDGAGRIWAGTVSGLFVLRGSRFAALGGPRISILPGRQIVSLPSNRLLVTDITTLREIQLDASGSFVSSRAVFLPAESKAYPAIRQVYGTAIAGDGTLWLSCGASICSWAQGKLLVFGPGQGVPEHYPRTLYFDHRGSLWAMNGTQLLELPRGTSIFQDRSPPVSNPGRYFPWSPIVEDRAGRIVVISGAEILRRENSSWVRIGPANGLDAGPISSILNDPNGDLWIGSFQGLGRWAGYERWEGWTNRQGLPNSGIWAVSARSDQLVVGTIEGPALLDSSKEKFVPLTFGREWVYGQVGGIARDHQSKIWMGTFRGLVLRIDQETRTVQQVAKLDVFIRRLFVSGDGCIWISTIGGLYVVRDPESSSPHVEHVDQPDLLLRSSLHLPIPGRTELISAGNQDDVNGQLWFLGTHSLLRFSSGTWAKISIAGLNEAAVGLKEAMVASDGSLWVAGEDALHHAAVWHLQPKANGMQAVPLALPPVLAGAVIYSILADRRGWLWIGTDNGLAGWNGTAWRLFDQDGGLIWNDTNRGALSESPDGSIWVGTGRGLAHLIHPEAAFSPVSVSAAILRMERGKEIYMPGEATRLQWAVDALQFHFASPGPWNRATLYFSYRLLGLDPSWKRTQNTVIGFSNLPPGKYRFQVFAETSGAASHSATVETAFTILPPWWRTVWFYCLCAGTAIVLLWLLHSLRTRQLLARQVALALERQNVINQERAHMAREIHDKLAQGYAAILMQQRALRRALADDPDAGKHHLDMIERLSKENLAEARRTMSDLRLDQLVPGDLRLALEGCLHPFTQEPEFKVTLELNGDLPLTPRYLENEVCRVVGEALTNVRKHARTDSANVSVHRVDGNLCICVQDDGVGFAGNPRSSSFGLASMYERAARIGGDLTITSTPGRGTSVVMMLKL